MQLARGAPRALPGPSRWVLGKGSFPPCALTMRRVVSVGLTGKQDADQQSPVQTCSSVTMEMAVAVWHPALKTTLEPASVCTQAREVCLGACVVLSIRDAVMSKLQLQWLLVGSQGRGESILKSSRRTGALSARTIPDSGGLAGLNNLLVRENHKVLRAWRVRTDKRPFLRGASCLRWAL